MFAVLSIHRTHAWAIDALRDSMLRYGEAIRTQAGLVEAHTVACEDGTMIGMALWKTQEDYERGRAAGGEAVMNDPFDQWESEPVILFKGQTCADSFESGRKSLGPKVLPREKI